MILSIKIVDTFTTVIVRNTLTFYETYNPQSLDKTIFTDFTTVVPIKF